MIMTPRLDPRMPAPDECVLPLVLDRFAAQSPERTFAVFADGTRWNYAQTREQALTLAGGLSRLGVQQGDKVLIWLPNAQLALRSWFGTNYLGAVSVAINTAYRGQILEHVVCNSDAKVAICHGDLVERLLELDHPGDLDIVITDHEKVASLSPAFAQRGISLESYDCLNSTPLTEVACSLKPWDLQSICYTSGTTGPSKGVLSSYLHLHSMGWHCTDGVTSEDRYLINLPLFHVGGTLFVTGALARGASIAVMGPFATDTFFSVCRQLQATQCLLLGAMAGFLARSDPSEDDRNHPMRRAMVIPLAEDARALSQRFGFDVVTLFNMTEVSAPLISDVNPGVRGTCGRLRAGIEARLVDDNDCEVPVGEAGELIVRADCPWVLSHGYYKMPEATARAWRNGWFHTGDIFRVDEQGNYFFVDRTKDAIRRRGENISSFEVEEQVLNYRDVLEAAVVGVDSELGEQDVMAVVVPKPGRSIDPADLVRYLSKQLPYFMVPRYVRTVAALPKTPTSKVEKHNLRRDGVTADTWDREDVGLRIKGEKFQ